MQLNCSVPFLLDFWNFEIPRCQDSYPGAKSPRGRRNTGGFYGAFFFWMWKPHHLVNFGNYIGKLFGNYLGNHHGISDGFYGNLSDIKKIFGFYG